MLFISKEEIRGGTSKPQTYEKKQVIETHVAWFSVCEILQTGILIETEGKLLLGALRMGGSRENDSQVGQGDDGNVPKLIMV